MLHSLAVSLYSESIFREIMALIVFCRLMATSVRSLDSASPHSTVVSGAGFFAGGSVKAVSPLEGAVLASAMIGYAVEGTLFNSVIIGYVGERAVWPLL